MLVKRFISLHMRVTLNLYETMREARLLNRSSLQAFLITQSTQKHIQLSLEAIDQIKAVRAEFIGPLIVHGAYWINLASGTDACGISFLKKEVSLAEQIGFTHYVVHPGSAIGCANRQEGMDRLIARLNYVTRRYTQITFVLENTAHGNNSIGSDLEDFAYIRSRLDFPERVALCFDTAHAFAAGYALQHAAVQENVIELLDRVWGLDAVALLHINDTHELCGSFKDRHARLGAGSIGLEPLKRFMNHVNLKQKPVIVETPPLSFTEQQKLLEELDNW